MTASWSHPVFEAISTMVRARAGLSFSPNRHALAEAGIRRAMARRGIADAAVYLSLFERGSVPFDDLITELRVGETYFFREPAHFQFIRDEVLPQVARHRGTDHLLRTWSAGCATGEEAYSLAILLEEARVNGHVLATDVSRSALEKARDARYRPWSLRGIDETCLHRFFHRTDDQWVLDRRPQRRVTFASHNLAESPYPWIPTGIWGMDVILCRNVLIYFDAESIKRVAQGLYDSLADDGWLITSPSDPPLDTVAPLTAVVTDAGVLYRRNADIRSLVTQRAQPVAESPFAMSMRDEAARACFLDPSLAIARFETARRAYRNVHDLIGARPPQERLALDARRKASR